MPGLAAESWGIPQRRAGGPQKGQLLPLSLKIALAEQGGQCKDILCRAAPLLPLPDTMHPSARSPGKQEPLPALPALLHHGDHGGCRRAWPRSGVRSPWQKAPGVWGRTMGHGEGQGGGTYGAGMAPRGVPGSPDEVAAENEAEHEDEDAGAENDHVDVERQVLERDGGHRAGFRGINQAQTAGAPLGEEREVSG